MVALVAVSAGALWASEVIARRNALDSVERAASRIANQLVAPALAEALAGRPGRWEELDRRVENRLTDPDIDRILVRAPNGTTLLPIDAASGPRVPPTPELLAALRGEIVATVRESGTGSAGAGSTGSPAGPSLVVYVPLRIGEEPLAVEVHFGYQAIEREAAMLRRQIVPLAVGGLLVLQLLQVPIAVSLVRRVRRHEIERSELMARSVTASERERRAIAADVHDGPVQELAGVSYALSALRGGVPAEQLPVLDRVIGTVRDAVRSLRRLIVDLYPPELGSGGLPPALEDLAAPLRQRGTSVDVDVRPVEGMDAEVAAVVYRTAKEALSNVARHADASNVQVRLSATVAGGRPAARLEVTDDGIGLDPAITDVRGDGHLGLALMRDRVRDAGGALHLGAAPGGGTSVVAVVPVAPAGAGGAPADVREVPPPRIGGQVPPRTTAVTDGAGGPPS